MKKQIFFLALTVLSTGLFAQKHETLFNKARVVGAFGAPIVEFGLYDGDDIGTSVGGGGALIIDNFFIGGYGIGSSDFTDQLFDNEDIFRLDLGHGGFWLGFTTPHYKMVHVFSSVKLGWGALGIEFDDEDLDYDDGIFVVTPELGLELNIFRFFRIAATAGYRHVEGIRDNGNVAADAFNGMVGTLTFRFGGFGHWHDNW